LDFNKGILLLEMHGTNIKKILNLVQSSCKRQWTFLATGLQSYTFDVSDVAGIERKLNVITVNSQASKSYFLYHTTLK
jgi:hypothetical protein